MTIKYRNAVPVGEVPKGKRESIHDGPIRELREDLTRNPGVWHEIARIKANTEGYRIQTRLNAGIEGPKPFKVSVRTNPDGAKIVYAVRLAV